MKIYIDNRSQSGGINSFITVYCDEKQLGRISVEANTINSIEIPSMTKELRISAILSWPPIFDKETFFEESPIFDNINKETISDLSFVFKKEKWEFRSYVLDSWEFPLDIVIDLHEVQDDIVLYFTNYPYQELKDASGYKARGLKNGNIITTKYVKRKSNFHTGVYKLLIFVITMIMVLISYYWLPICWEETFHFANPDKAHIICVWAIPLFDFALLPFLTGVISGKDILPESKLKSEYYLDSDGNWSSSEE